MQPDQREPLSRVAWAAWLGVALALARAGVVLGLEQVHHGELRLAWLRLASAFLALTLTAGLIAAAAGVGARLSGARRGGRWLGMLALGSAGFLFLVGRFDGDRSRRIGADTALGQLALATAAAVALILAAGYVFARPRGLGRTLASAAGLAFVPVALWSLVWAALHLASDGPSATMEVRRAEHALVDNGWEFLRSRAESPPAVGLLCPSAEYRLDGAAKPALVMPPPALARRTLGEFDGLRWLVGAAGVDHTVAEEVAQHYPGHAVLLRVRVNGAEVDRATLPLEGAATWHELGGGEGFLVHGGARIELETALLAPDGREVQPELSILTGFGGLALERRERIPRTRSSREHPNLVLVVFDTLRADRTSAYGYPRPTTPHLDALARRGVTFDEVSATASWTWPSTASILTGLYPEEHGVEDAASSFLGAALDTLPEALQRAGFTTAAWSGSPLIVPDKGFDQGFELFDASREGRLRRSDLVLPGALEWLGTLRGTRFFLYLHLMEPHAPFQPLAAGRAQLAADVPRDYDPRKVLDYNWQLQSAGFGPSGERRTENVVSQEEQRWIGELYDGCVWSADHYLGLLLEQLTELGLAGSTILAVTSDHGEELFEHGLVTHGSTLHRELIRVPLVLAGPGLAQGERVATPLSGVALAPTLARLVGAALEGLAAPLDLFQPNPDGAALFSTRQGWWNGYARQPLFGLRRGSTVLHYAPAAAPWGGAQPGPGELRLYDLAQDPAEERDLSPSEPARAKALRAELLRLLGSLEERRSAYAVPPDPATLQRLEGLGYGGK